MGALLSRSLVERPYPSMSTHQQSKPRRANQSITEESGRPGTCRSKVGCAAMDEPCTNKMVPDVAFGSLAYFSNRKSFALASLAVQCSSLLTAADAAPVTSFMHAPSVDQGDVVRRNYLSPFGDLSVHEVGEGGLRHHHRRGPLCLPRRLDVGAAENAGYPAIEQVDDWLRRVFRRHEADPLAELKARHTRFGDCGDVRQDRRTLQSGGAETAHHARFDQRCHGWNGVE